MRVLSWYFDFISPFAYLQTSRLGDFPDDVRIEPRPVLLGPILAHWSTLGPAEIPQMRTFTYQHVLWYARRRGIPLQFPPRHPFNPLGALRLALVVGSGVEPVVRIFRHIWADGRAVDDESEFTALAASLGVADPLSLTEDPAIKRRLRENTEEAIERGVFGVPTFAVDERLFWGNDATDMLLDYLRDPKGFDDTEMQRVSGLPVGASRNWRSGSGSSKQRTSD